MKKFGAFNVSSSTNPKEISLTIESIVKVIGLIIGGFLTVKGSSIVIDDVTLEQTSNALTIIAVSGMSIWQSANILFGIFRKFTKEDN